ncbi:hypothetical protein [Nitratifractor sp.]
MSGELFDKKRFFVVEIDDGTITVEQTEFFQEASIGIVCCFPFDENNEFGRICFGATSIEKTLRRSERSDLLHQGFDRMQRSLLLLGIAIKAS